MLKTGDKILIEGREVVIESIWAQGRHTRFNLSDGTSALDLHLQNLEVIRDKETKSDLKWQQSNSSSIDNQIDELGL